MSLTDGTLGLKAIKPDGKESTYAVDARGTVELVGLPLTLGGTFGVRSNNTGSEVNETISVPNLAGGADLEVSLDLPADQATTFIGKGVTLSVLDVFTIGGDLEVSRQDDGKLLVDIQEAALSLIVNQQEVIRLGGGAKFTLGGSEGFKLESFTVGGSSFTPPGSPGGSGGSKSKSRSRPRRIRETPHPQPPAGPATTLGPLEFSTPKISVSGFELGRLDLANQKFPLSITVGVEIASAKLNLGDDAFTASATKIGGSFGVGLQLSTQVPYILDFATTGEWELHAEEFKIGVGEFLELKATNLKLDPGARPDEDLMSFGTVSATVTLGDLGIKEPRILRFRETAISSPRTTSPSACR